MPNKSVGDKYFSIGYERKSRFILEDHEIIGLVEIHKNTLDNEMCGCTIWFGDEPENWELLSIDPLVIWPSIICENCDSHGFILEDEWVDEIKFNDKKIQIMKDYLNEKHNRNKS